MTDLEIFAGAPMGATGNELAAYLDEACSGDGVLRAKVEALIAANREASEGGFMASHAEGAQATVVKQGGSLMEGPGVTVGNFKLLQEIGEGGFGQVYMAEQLRPVKRRVALKIIKAGMDSRQVVARFEAERQALAMMDHPNIAKVYDAGETETGRPFFVMELVKGIPITEFCDDRNLSTEERLELFIDVCHAVQHAHQKGVIHRDLKPSNIMVTLLDDEAVVKVIDFGVAKATQMELTDKTLFTMFEQFIGTPAYMSPEQAQMSGLDIDTRSDIYALGVLLYELLTGRTPFDQKELLKAGYDEMRRVIREDEPPKPSTRMSTLADGELTDLAKHRKSEPQKLKGLLRGDLDWIVMKALEKDRARRYETATGFAQDVGRHLRDEPVVAAAPSLFYHITKFGRRNKKPIGVTLFAVLLLLGASAILIWQRVSATRATEARLSAEERMVSIASTHCGIVLNEIERHLQTRAANWLAYSRSALVRETLAESNAEFAALLDPNAFLQERDALYLSRESLDHLEFVWETLTSPLAMDLGSTLDTLREISGYPVFGEVVITNGYGAIVAMTGMESDYRQDDEESWQQAADEGLHVGRMSFDASSGIYSMDLSVRIDDLDGEMIGVLSAVLNIREVTEILDNHAEDLGAGVILVLLTSEGEIIRVGEKTRSPPDYGSLVDGGWVPPPDGQQYLNAASIEGAKVSRDPEGNAIIAVKSVGREGSITRNLGWTVVLQLQMSP